MTWEDFIKSCDKDRQITILSLSRFKRILGKPERVYIEKDRVHCEYGYIGGQIVNKDFTGEIEINTFIYWLRTKLPVRKGRKNSLTVIYRCCPAVIQNPIIVE